MKPIGLLATSLLLFATALAGCVGSDPQASDALQRENLAADWFAVAVAWAPVSPVAGEVVEFSAEFTPIGEVVGVSWVIEAQTLEGATVEHTFDEKGTYTITVLVRTDGQARGTAMANVTVRAVGEAPPPDDPASPPETGPSEGNGTSENQTSQPETGPVKYALFVHNGITHGTQDMEGAEEDVHLGDAGWRLLLNISRTVESAGFKRENMAFLYDDGQVRDGDGRTEKVVSKSPYPAATRANFNAALDRMIAGANARGGSEVLIFMEDHGNLDPQPGRGRVGSYFCLQDPADHSACDELYDYELGDLLKPLKPEVAFALMLSCSFCGGFADKIYGPVEEPSAGVTGPGRVVTVSDSIITECFSNTLYGHIYFYEWHEGARTGDADGWGPVDGATEDVPLGLPLYTEPDKSISVQEAYWWSTGPLNQAFFPLSTECGFQLDDQLGKPFVVNMLP